MAFDLSSITTGRVDLPPRIIILGTPKVGKSTFGCSAPDVIALPIKGEEGVDDLDCAKFPTCPTFDDVISALASLAEGEHKYRYVMLDSTSTLEPMIWDAVCREVGDKNGRPCSQIELVGGGYGKGYASALSYWRRITDTLDYLRRERGMGCILTGHVKVKVFNDPLVDPYDQFQWDVHQQAASCLLKWADVILFARHAQYTRTLEDTGKGKNPDRVRASGTGERRLYTQERPAHPGGGRGVYGRLPYEIPLSWADWMAAVSAASK